ncbi:MAG: electron transporter SenC [Armatimonadota bacterium]|nr:MAG: electron transporter SenC [Armatimonadota bacterium]
MKTGIAIAVFTICLLVPASAQFWQQREPEKSTNVNLARDITIEQKLNEQVPLDLTFRDETGKTVPLKQYFGQKPVLLTLVYYECPSLCGLVLQGLLKSLRVLNYTPGEQFEIVTVSISPSETPELAATKKQNFLKEYGRLDAAKGWHWLTGEEQNIRALADAVGFRYVYDPKSKQYAHAAGIILLTPSGRVSRYFYGIEYSPRDLRLGIMDASQGKVGSLVEKVILFCYQYDPTTGKYSLVVIRIVQLASVLTLLVLGGFMATQFYREKRVQSLRKREEVARG